MEVQLLNLLQWAQRIALRTATGEIPESTQYVGGKFPDGIRPNNFFSDATGIEREDLERIEAEQGLRAMIEEFYDLEFEQGYENELGKLFQENLTSSPESVLLALQAIMGEAEYSGNKIGGLVDISNSYTFSDNRLAWLYLNLLKMALGSGTAEVMDAAGEGLARLGGALEIELFDKVIAKEERPLLKEDLLQYRNELARRISGIS
jgi:hypothetical protein